MIDINHAMMLWNPDGGFRVVSHPEGNIKALAMSAGACDSFWKEISVDQKVKLILSNALTVIDRDGCNPSQVCSEISKIKEVKDFIAVDHLHILGIEP